MRFLDNLKKRYLIRGTNLSGIHTGRRRYLVACLECGKTLHEATTGAKFLITQHESEPCTPEAAPPKPAPPRT
jgi:hypothetical protein